MAARKHKGTKDNPWPLETREKIRTSMLLNRLHQHVFNERDPKTKQPIVMTSTQVKAVEILLRKVLPDLQSIEGNLNHTVKHEDALDGLE